MIRRHKLVIVIVILCTLIIGDAESAGTTVDCKKIDNRKFKETFEFNYGGGQRGLELKFNFINKNNNDFKVGDCKFQLVEGKFSQINVNSYKRMQGRKLNALLPCTKYRLELTVKNMASNAKFTYENFVTTRPEGNILLELIAANVSDSRVTFKTATNASDACFVRYQLSVKNDRKEVIYENATLTTKDILLENLAPSEAYSAEISAFDDKGSKVTSKAINFRTQSSDNCNEISEPNINLEVRSLTSSSVQLKWNSNLAVESIYHLEILEATGSSVFSANYSNNSAVINNLSACSQYIARISIPCATKIVSTNFGTLAAMPGEVSDIHFHSNHTSAVISWTPPELNVACITNYTIRLTKVKSTNDSTSFFTAEKDVASYVLAKLPYAKKLLIHVYANWNTLDGKPALINNSSGREFEHINIDKFVVGAISEFRLSPTEVQLRWSFDIYFSDILKEFQVYHDGKMIATNQSLINLDIQACKKNYTILIRCSSLGGNFGPNITYHTRLDDESVQLSAIPENSFSFAQTNNKTFLISWMAAVREAPCIDHYEIMFNATNSNSIEPKMELSELIPCTTYGIHVTPISKGDTRGKITNFEFTTNVIAPKTPSQPQIVKSGNRELLLSTSISNNDKYCVSMTATILEIECNGNLVQREINDSLASYEMSVSGLHPNTEYECTAMLRNDKGSSQKSEVAVLKTLEDSPQTPTNVTATVNTNNSVIVDWVSDNSTGFADYFKINIKLLRLLYDIPSDCKWNSKNVTIIEATTPKHVIKDLKAHAEYSLKIVAVNDHGSSEESKEVFFVTYSAAASSVRNIAVEINQDLENITAVLSWKPPCEINGRFQVFSVSMVGKRKGFENHFGKEQGQKGEINLYGLRMGYKYDVEIRTILDSFEYQPMGIPTKFSFYAPSGIPHENDLAEWTNENPAVVEHDHIEIFLKRKIFFSSVGDIVGIAFLIFLNNCNDLPQPTFGYRSLDSQLLSSSQDMKCAQLYQQTEILQNTLDHDIEIESADLEAFNVKFTVGDSKCSTSQQYCNRLLMPGVKYGLMARVYTKDAFRDTTPIFFQTKTRQPLPFSPLVIVAGSTFILLMISLAICICCCWSLQKQKKLKKEKEAAETVENLLSFTSYCVIDKNPTPRNQFDPLL